MRCTRRALGPGGGGQRWRLEDVLLCGKGGLDMRVVQGHETRAGIAWSFGHEHQRNRVA